MLYRLLVGKTLSEIDKKKMAISKVLWYHAKSRAWTSLPLRLLWASLFVCQLLHEMVLLHVSFHTK